MLSTCSSALRVPLFAPLLQLLNLALLGSDDVLGDLAYLRVYEISVWDLKGQIKDQKNLVICLRGEPIVTADDLEVAQFIYLLLNNEKIRNVIEVMTSKVVLVLGNFAPEREEILEAIRERLRCHGYVPILFDFERPSSKDIEETVTTLARLARFVVTDLTFQRSVPLELGIIIPEVEVPIVPLIEGSERPVATLSALLSRPSYRHRLLDLWRYRNPDELLANFDEMVLAPADARFVEL